MDDPIYSGSVPDWPAGTAANIAVSNQPHGTGWSIVLVFACVALGFTASAADYERIVANSERNQAGLLGTECSAVEGQIEDLGKFLADPNTRLIPLVGSGEFAAAPAAIAWNSVQRHGYFLCDDLPVLDSGRGYELWALHGMDDPVNSCNMGCQTRRQRFSVPGLGANHRQNEVGDHGRSALSREKSGFRW